MQMQGLNVVSSIPFYTRLKARGLAVPENNWHFLDLPETRAEWKKLIKCMMKTESYGFLPTNWFLEARKRG